MMAPLISPVCKYRQATSTDTKLPEQAVSMVILYGIDLSLDADWGSPVCHPYLGPLILRKWLIRLLRIARPTPTVMEGALSSGSRA